MTSSTTSDSLAASVRAGFGVAATVRVRRPRKLFQIEVPAFLEDGDGVQLYVEVQSGGVLRVSDLGLTLMRLSYTRTIDDAALARLARIAERNGFAIDNGSIVTDVNESEIVPALFGLAQIQAVAEASVHVRIHRGPRAGDFREMVVAALRKAFGDRVTSSVKLDNEEAFSVDAIIAGHRPLGVFAVPNDVEAERAIGTRYRAAKDPQIRDWVAVPRNIEEFSSRTRSRLIDAFVIAHAKFDEQAVNRRLMDLAS